MATSVLLLSMYASILTTLPFTISSILYSPSSVSIPTSSGSHTIITPAFSPSVSSSLVLGLPAALSPASFHRISITSSISCWSRCVSASIARSTVSLALVIISIMSLSLLDSTSLSVLRPASCISSWSPSFLLVQ